MTATGEQLVEEYLRRFDNASVFLTDERRTELRQEIVEHITAGVDVASIEEAGAADAEAVRRVLDRLGPPADIVAAETSSGTTGSTPVVDRGAAPAGGPAPGGDEQGPERHGAGHRGHEGLGPGGHGAEGREAERHDSRPARGTPDPRAASYGERADRPRGTSAPRPSARFRKGPLLLIAGAATAVLLATVAVASDISGGESGPAVERTPMPTRTATESESPSETPTETPTETPAETPAETAGESSSPPSSRSSSPAAAPESSSASPEDTTTGPTPTDTSE